MQQYNIKNILASGQKVAVHVPSEEEAKEVVKIIRKETSINPLNGSDLDDNIGLWNKNKVETCVDLTGFSPKSFFEREGYTIIPASLFIQHNTPKIEKKPFAVTSSEWELYVRFKEEVERMGWKYEPGYMRIDRYNYDKNMINNEELVYLNDGSFNVCDTVESTTPIYSLETQYPEAIAAAKEWFEPQVDATATIENEHVKKLEESVQLWKDRYETMSKEVERLQSVIYAVSREKNDLKEGNSKLLQQHQTQHTRHNSELTAITILLSSFSSQPTHRQKQFAVDCIMRHINSMITTYSEPDTSTLPF